MICRRPLERQLLHVHHSISACSGLATAVPAFAHLITAFIIALITIRVRTWLSKLGTIAGKATGYRIKCQSFNTGTETQLVGEQTFS